MGWEDEHMTIPDPGIVQGPNGPRAADPWEMPSRVRRKPVKQKMYVQIAKGGGTQLRMEGFDDSSCLEASKPYREAIGGQQETKRCSDSSGGAVEKKQKELE